MIANPYQRYFQNQVYTASPERLILMLYDGALKFLKSARAAIPEKDFDKANSCIGRVQDIVTELMVSLDMNQGDVSGNLYVLYDYINNRLIQANLAKDTAILAEVENMLSTLRDTWREVIVGSKIPGKAIGT
jgi:flagellar protein FliS